MKRIMFIVLILIYCFIPTANAAALDAAALASELGQVQSLENMKLGIYAIPEGILSSHFSAIAADNPKVKETSLSIKENNKVIIALNAADVGNIRLTCVIKELHFDKSKSVLKLYIEKKEIIGNSLASWLLNNMSIGFITDIYGNPLSDTNVKSKVKGNHIEIDLEPFAASLFKTGIGTSIGSQFVISKVTTGNGVLYLHTNLSLSLLPQ